MAEGEARRQMTCQFKAPAICSPDFQQKYREPETCRTSCPKMRFGNFAIQTKTEGERAADEITHYQRTLASDVRAGKAKPGRLY